MAEIERGEGEPLRTKSGQVLTEEAIEALSREAERGYDLTEARRERVGRPSLGKEGESPRVHFRVDLATYSAAQRKAKEESRSVSAIAREALERYVRGAGDED